jgi:ABC-type uncharacterized transport system YnjBCD ATPase subunit
MPTFRAVGMTQKTIELLQNQDSNLIHLDVARVLLSCSQAIACRVKGAIMKCDASLTKTLLAWVAHRRSEETSGSQKSSR